MYICSSIIIKVRLLIIRSIYPYFYYEIIQIVIACFGSVFIYGRYVIV